MPEYAMTLLVLLVMSIFFHHKYKVKLFKSKQHMLVSYTILLLVGAVWDYLAISRGYWSFGERFLLGPKIGLMPVEEWGFIIIVTYFVLVIYKVTEKLFGENKF